MAVPKKRTSHRRKGMRRSHDGLKFNASVELCFSCDALKLRHHVCEKCGYYHHSKKQVNYRIQIGKVKSAAE